MDLSASITTLPGIGPNFAQKLAKLDITTLFDLLYHIPSRYEDRTLITQLAHITQPQTYTSHVTIDTLTTTRTKSGKHIQLATVSDPSGKFQVVWINQLYLLKTLLVGNLLTISGKVDHWGNKLAFISPAYSSGHIKEIVSVYPQTAGVTSKWLSSQIKKALTMLPEEILPSPPKSLPHWKNALTTVHFPKSLATVDISVTRLAFDELFLSSLTTFLNKKSWLSTPLLASFNVDQSVLDKFISQLPYHLSQSQHQAVSDILSDLKSLQPMNRLVIGDVGSGKTILAAIAALVTQSNNFQTAILAPTQILAQQHFHTLSTLLPNVFLLTSHNRPSTLPHNAIVVGTHALLSHPKLISNTGLVVIDEQHRFGVLQRSLAASLGKSPHILTMTATPIPRTICLTKYSDLEVSFLAALPNRQPVKTWVVPSQKNRRRSHLDLDPNPNSIRTGVLGLPIY
jgi:ATP-dependent DNA helicase RecG